MGPPSMNGGRSNIVQVGADYEQGFNGAAVDERRKAGSPQGSTGIRARFNGAAVDERRKVERGHSAKLHCLRASMGPPSMNGGRRQALDAEHQERAGFNGAAVDERRKVEPASDVEYSLDRLQWGRRR